MLWFILILRQTRELLITSIVKLVFYDEKDDVAILQLPKTFPCPFKNSASMGDLKGDFAPKTEFIIFFQKGRRLINGKRDSNVFVYNKTKNKLHPTQKPVDMTEYMLSKFSDK